MTITVMSAIDQLVDSKRRRYALATIVLLLGIFPICIVLFKLDTTPQAEVSLLSQDQSSNNIRAQHYVSASPLLFVQPTNLSAYNRNSTTSMQYLQQKNQYRAKSSNKKNNYLNFANNPYLQSTSSVAQNNNNNNNNNNKGIFPIIGWQNSWLQKDLSITQTRTEAIVITTPYVTDCIASRIRHLMNTYRDNSTTNDDIIRHVWVATSHHMFPSSDPRVIRSIKIIESIPSLRSLPTSKRRSKSFDSEASGSTKSSFLRFLKVHPYYDFAWHIESDLFYTGNWSEIFSLYQNDTSDVVAKMYSDVKLQWWSRLGDCILHKKLCYEIYPEKTTWMIIRVSQRLATKIIQLVDSGAASGHHEAVVAPICGYYNFTIHNMTNATSGKIVAGHWGEWKDSTKMTLERLEPQRHLLYHPVKCESYDDFFETEKYEHNKYNKSLVVPNITMQQLIDKWTKD